MSVTLGWQRADDIGVLLRTPRDLPILHWIFGIMAKVINQVLGFPKFVLVPITGPPKLAWIDDIGGSISRIAPHMECFQSGTFGRIPGGIMGPNTSSQSSGVQQKFDSVVQRIVSANVSAFLSLMPYNAKAVTTYSYKAQVRPP